MHRHNHSHTNPHRRHQRHVRGEHRGRGHGRGHGGRGRGRGRVMRGEVRTAILHLLTEESMHGYQIMQEIHERSDNAWQPSPGSIYPTLQQLADEGLVISESVGGKNVFSLTDDGKAKASELGDTPPWERMSEDQAAGALSLWKSMGQLADAVKTMARTGNEAQIEQAATLLTNARRGIYALLAADD